MIALSSTVFMASACRQVPQVLVHSRGSACEVIDLALRIEIRDILTEKLQEASDFFQLQVTERTLEEIRYGLAVELLFPAVVELTTGRAGRVLSADRMMVPLEGWLVRPGEIELFVVLWGSGEYANGPWVADAGNALARLRVIAAMSISERPDAQ